MTSTLTREPIPGGREPHGVLVVRAADGTEQPDELVVVTACALCRHTDTRPYDQPEVIADAHLALGRHIAGEHRIRRVWVRCLGIPPDALTSPQEATA